MIAGLSPIFIAMLSQKVQLYKEYCKFKRARKFEETGTAMISRASKE